MWVFASKNQMVVVIRVTIIIMYKYCIFTHGYNDLSTWFIKLSLKRYFDICYNLDNKSTERQNFLICHEKMKPGLNLIVKKIF